MFPEDLNSDLKTRIHGKVYNFSSTCSLFQNTQRNRYIFGTPYIYVYPTPSEYVHLNQCYVIGLGTLQIHILVI